MLRGAEAPRPSVCCDASRPLQADHEGRPGEHLGTGPAPAAREGARRPLSGAGSRLSAPDLSRPHASDPAAFKQVIRDAEYDVVPPTTDVELVIDCGANVGFTSLYLLNRFPTCRLIAVEPDPENFVVLQRNLAPYRDRVVTINSGVWSHAARLRMSEEQFRDGREWARVVRECLPGEEAQFIATDIGTLFREAGASRISVLKMDVERSEREVFARNYESWLPAVDTIAIELHDDECRAVFQRTIASQGAAFEIRELREADRRGAAAGPRLTCSGVDCGWRRKAVVPEHRRLACGDGVNRRHGSSCIVGLAQSIGE